MVILRRAGARSWFCLWVLGTLAACSGGNNDTGVTAAVGTASGVAITSSTGVSSLLAGENLTLTAAVTGDTNSAGVTWILDGDGTLTNVTTTSATYNAPASLAGTSTPLITATSVASTAQQAVVTLVVSGTPVIDAAPLFPGNLNSAYAANVAANGGKSPYTWELTSGTLPAGITKAGNTTSYESFSGTPTAQGSFPFTVKVTDANGATSSAGFTLVINAAASCLINGRYALLTSGLASSSPTTRAAALNIDSAGAITGITDRKTGGTTTGAESLTGTCVNRVANSGELRLVASSESPNYNFSVTGSLAEGRVQLSNGGSTQAAAGHLYQQAPAAFNLASIAGSYAFGTLGAESGDRRFGLIGQFTVSASGVISAGRVDSNGATAITGAAITGTMSAPDANGRGTLSFAGSGVSYTFAYYVVNAGKLLLISVDTGSSGARLTGFATRRAALFDASTLTGAGVFSQWGNAAATIQPTSVMSLGRLSGGNAGTGAISMLMDTADRNLLLPSQSSSTASYSMEGDGRANITATIAGNARTFTLYLDAPNNGYMIERGVVSGSAGLLEAQAAGPFNRTLPGIWVSGTQFPESASPMTLLPQIYIVSGSITAGSSNGFAAISATTGRGLGSINTSGFSATNMAFYYVQPNKARLLHFGNSSENAAIDWYVN
jgi:Putative Ig domain